MLLLGPMPEDVRAVVRWLVADSRRLQPDQDERLNGLMLTGGPSGCSFLDADGRVWNWCAWDESIDLVPDGPLKVGLVAIAAERVPGLAAWLPVRPPGVPDCTPCRGSGWMPPPWPRMQCPECRGVGWVHVEDPEPGT